MSISKVTFFAVLCVFSLACGNRGQRPNQNDASKNKATAAEQASTKEFFSKLRSGTYENKNGIQISIDSEKHTFKMSLPGRVYGEKGLSCDFTVDGSISKVVLKKTEGKSDAYSVSYVHKAVKMDAQKELEASEKTECEKIKTHNESQLNKDQTLTIISLSQEGFELEKSLVDSSANPDGNSFVLRQ